MQKNALRSSILFSLFGVLLFLGDLLMEAFPNIHLVGALLALFTRVYRAKALIPLYLYVGLTGLFYGFSTWWIPYLYVWLFLWAGVMLLPKTLSPRAEFWCTASVCALHGILFGVLYAPAQAILFGLDLKGTLAWILAGLPFDLLHAAGNFAACLLLPPLARLLRRMERKSA